MLYYFIRFSLSVYEIVLISIEKKHGWLRLFEVFYAFIGAFLRFFISVTKTKKFPFIVVLEIIWKLING